MFLVIILTSILAALLWLMRKQIGSECNRVVTQVINTYFVFPVSQRMQINLNKTLLDLHDKIDVCSLNLRQFQVRMDTLLAGISANQELVREGLDYSFNVHMTQFAKVLAEQEALHTKLALSIDDVSNGVVDASYVLANVVTRQRVAQANLDKANTNVNELLLAMSQLFSAHKDVHELLLVKGGA
jgi:hypothetical protein